MEALCVAADGVMENRNPEAFGGGSLVEIISWIVERKLIGSSFKEREQGGEGERRRLSVI